MFARISTARALFIAVTIFSSMATLGAPGEWDQTYGSNGRVELVPGTGTFNSITQFVPQSDGKIVFAGWIFDGGFPGGSRSLFIARITADGVFDNTFGTGGLRRLDVGPGDEDPTVSIVQQADGKLLMALTMPAASPINNHAAVLRLNADGSTDTTYGTNGLADVHPTGDTRPSYQPKIVLNPDGTSVVIFSIGSSDMDLMLRRLTAAGTIDTTFGTAGVTTIDQGTDQLLANSMVRQPNGSFAIGGFFFPQGSAPPQPCVIRVTPNGARDTTFDADGVLPITAAQGAWRITAVRADADNRIVMLGLRDNTGDSFIARLTASGALDPTFGSQGRILPGSRTSASAIALEPDGRIVAGGVRTDLGVALSWIARYKTDGAPDPSFGVQGWIATDLAMPGESINGSIGISSRIRQLVRQSDGAYLSLSAAAALPDERLVLVKYRASGASPGALGLNTLSPVGIAPPLLQENTGVPLRLIAYRSGGVSGQVSVSYRVVSGTAIVGQDVEAATGTLTWNDGEYSVKPFEVKLIDDTVADSGERFKVELFNATGGATISNDHVEAQIAEMIGEDLGSSISVSPENEVLEGRSAQITLARRGNLSGTARVDYTTTGGFATATEGADFPAASGSVTWAPNEGGMKSITVATSQDAIGETQESFEVRFTTTSPGVSIADGKTTVRIIDDENVVIPGAHPDAWIMAVPESATSVTIPMNRIGDPTQPLSVTYTTSINPPTATPGTEFDPVSGSLDWAANETGPKTIQIALTPDTIPEPDERFVVNFSGNGGGIVIVYIIDDDIPVAPATVSFASPTLTVAENAGSVPIQVSLSSPVREAVGVTARFIAGTANGADAEAFDKPVTWQPGESGTKTLNVPITNDAVDELDESFTLSLQLPDNIAAGANKSVRVTITDDDATPAGGPTPVVPQISMAQTAVSIGENERTVTLQVQRLGDPTANALVSWATSGGTANSPADFLAQSGVLQWNTGESAAKTIEIALNGDTDHEPNETFDVVLNPFVEGPGVGTARTTVTLLDDDDVSAPPARLGFMQGAVTVGEAQTSVSVQVARTGNANNAVTVNYRTIEGSAGTSDFTTASGTLMWAANDTTAKTLTLTLSPDTTDEPDETFSVVLSAPSAGAELDTTSTAVVTITDDDAPAPPPSTGNGGGGGGGGGLVDPLSLLALGLLLLISCIITDRRWKPHT